LPGSGSTVLAAALDHLLAKLGFDMSVETPILRRYLEDNDETEIDKELARVAEMLHDANCEVSLTLKTP